MRYKLLSPICHDSTGYVKPLRRLQRHGFIELCRWMSHFTGLSGAYMPTSTQLCPKKTLKETCTKREDDLGKKRQYDNQSAVATAVVFLPEHVFECTALPSKWSIESSIKYAVVGSHVGKSHLHVFVFRLSFLAVLVRLRIFVVMTGKQWLPSSFCEACIATLLKRQWSIYEESLGKATCKVNKLYQSVSPPTVFLCQRKVALNRSLKAGGVCCPRCLQA